MPASVVIVVDDDASVRMVVGEALRRAGHDVLTTDTLAGMRDLVEAGAGDVLVMDAMLPDGNGLDSLPLVIQRRPDLPIIMMSARNTLATAVRATGQGAFEYLPKPFDLNELTGAVRSALENKSVTASEPVVEPESLPMIGRSPAMQMVYRTLARLIPTDLTVMVLGESGTGKELVARALHDLGPRQGGPFVAINMAAIPRELIETELFGHERGAFTGAQARSAGRFEQAAGGTLFLDEIGDMPLDAQTRLLRVLQSGEFSPVGGNRSRQADVRIVVATHKNLPRMIADGAFREDLFHRLNVVPVSLPPLRDRAEDVADLAEYFLREAVAAGLSRKRLDASAMEWLQQRAWPGNVRELENAMRRVAALARDELVTAQTLAHWVGQGAPDAAPGVTHYNTRQIPAAPGTGPQNQAVDGLEPLIGRWLDAYIDSGGQPDDGLYARLLAQLERPLLEAALRLRQGNQVQAARLLGVNRNTLRRMLVDHGLQPHASRRG